MDSGMVVAVQGLGPGLEIDLDLGADAIGARLDGGPRGDDARGAGRGERVLRLPVDVPELQFHVVADDVPVAADIELVHLVHRAAGGGAADAVREGDAPVVGVDRAVAEDRLELLRDKVEGGLDP